jgi:hypothetical protein
MGHVKPRKSRALAVREAHIQSDTPGEPPQAMGETKETS